MLTLLDDKFTIIYKYVIKDKLPFSFFTLQHNHVYRIGDINMDINVDKDFDPLDLFMVYFEKQWPNDQLTIYKSSLSSFKSSNKIVELNDLEEYQLDELIQWYDENYQTYNTLLKKYFENQKYIYYKNDITPIFERFSKTGDVNVFKLIINETEYQLVNIENELDIDFVPLYQFKNQFESLRRIQYDKQSLINEYKEWLINTDKRYQDDLQKALVIDKIQQFLLSSTSDIKDIKNSPESLDKLIQIFNPILRINKQNVTKEDGLDLFNDAKLDLEHPYLIYHDKQQDYYKMYSQTNVHIDLYKSISPYHIHYPVFNAEKHQYDCNYDLTQNLFHIHYHHLKNQMININIFDSIILGDPVDFVMNGHVNLWQIEIDKSALLKLILTHPDLNRILYVDDKPKYLTRAGIYLKYIPLYQSDTVVSITITQRFFDETKMVNSVENDDIQKLKLTKKGKSLIPYLDIHFKNVYDYKLFLFLIKLLLSKVITKSLAINALFHELEYKKGKEIDENLKMLKSLAPQAFVEGYANFCDLKKRPTPIESDRVNQYLKGKKKEYNLNTEEFEEFKQMAVLDFSNIKLVCDHTNDKYPYLKSTLKSKKLPALDKNQYPNLPCCKTNPPKEKKEKKDHAHITTYHNVLDPNSTGDIKPDHKYILDNYDTNQNHFIRIGVIDDNQSLLRCLCLAKNIDYHMDLKSTIVNQIHVSVCKQEMFDFDINDFLSDAFLDADLYYRLLEEYFNVNIYIFNVTTLLALPRYKLFHSRPARLHRQTVLLYQINQHYELIINHNQKIFDATMSTYCHQLLQHQLSTLTLTDKNFVYGNLYYYADHLSFLKPVSQFIDRYGKTRAFHIMNRDKMMTIMTLPCQPENLPIDNHIYQTAMDDVMRIMTQKPTALSLNNDNKVCGLWYQIFDLKLGEFIPILPVGNIKQLDLEIVPPPSLYYYNNIKNYEHRSYYDTKKLLNIILQIIIWLFYVCMYQFNLVTSVDEFFNQYVIIIDDDNYDKLLTIPRKFPIFNEFKDYIMYVKSYCDSCVVDGKIVMMNDVFYHQTKQHIIDYHLNEDNHKIPIVIRDYYKNVDDFTKIENNIIFLNRENVDVFMYYRNKDMILNHIQPPNMIYPYLYKLPSGNIYMIQNVQTGLLQHVLYIIDYWIKNTHNLGYDNINNFDNKIIIPTIYRINDQQQLELVNNGAPLYNVIDYNYRPDKIGQYAAMLNIV
ncbi:MAG TPA: hypothetical protein VLG50_06605 [Candidatus Saccharimonadales bacterium]|nr:hypothetical protein [Candidatus Saccharimonadales bacterium]